MAASTSSVRSSLEEEQQRLSLLAELGVLDTEPEPGLDALTRTAAATTQCPIALISLVDGERQWFKSHIGLSERETPREWAFCNHAIRTPDLMEVRDATADVRFAANPLVVGSPFVRFYAGQPLTVGGIRIGTLCVIDTRPRELAAEAREALQDLAAAASAMLAERRRRAVSAEQQRRLTEFAMVAGDWLWETDAENRIVWMSCAYGNLPPMPEPWSTGQPMADGQVLLSHDEANTAPITLHELFAQRLGFARALVKSEFDGEWRYLSHSAVSRRDPSGHWCGYRGITRDVTASVASESAHRVAAALLADLSAQVPGVIFQMRLDAAGSLSFPFVSNRIDGVCELSAQAVMADAGVAMQRCHVDDADRVAQSIQASAATLLVWRETFRMVLPRAGERTLLVQAEPRRLDGGGVLWHGLMTDISEQIVATRHLQQMTLAQSAAEKAVEVRSEFMSRVSHELRTPLNAILGFAQMLRLTGARQSGAAVLGSVRQIESAGAHLLALVNDMLDLSSLDAGRLNLVLEPVALAPLVERCIALVGPHAQQHGIIFESGSAASVPTVLADVRAVRQLLFNLLGNAVKFAHPDTAVRVQLDHDAPAGRVTLAVIDTGPGIAAEKLPSLFEPFGRLHAGRTMPAGSGLGLAITQKLVRAMAGTITVASVPGEGTTITVTLPVDGRPAMGFDDDSVFGGLQMPAPAVAIGASTVLYIEDEPVNTLLMQAIFDSLPVAGPRLVVAVNGADGLAEAAKLRPDLILLDMNLPDIDGLSVLAALSAGALTAHIPVIAVSADAMPAQIVKARQAGCQDYWTKPIDVKQVQARLLGRFQADASEGD